MTEPLPFSPDPVLLAQDWQHTFDALDDFVAVLDAEFRLVKINRAMADFLGSSAEELVGQFCYRVMHKREDHWAECPHERMLATHRTVTLEVDDPQIGVPLLVTVAPLFKENGDLLGSIHIAKDISRFKAIERELQSKNRQLEGLNRLTAQAIETQQVSELIAAALENIRAICAIDQVLYYRKENMDLVLGGALPAEGDLNQRKKVGTCLCGLAAAKKVPVFSVDISSDARCTLHECKAAGVHSFAALPLLQHQEVLGIIGLASKTDRDFSVEREFLETLAATLSMVLSNARLIETLQHQAIQLEERVRERTGELEARNRELERFNKLFVDREFRIKELRDRVGELETVLGRKGHA